GMIVATALTLVVCVLVFSRSSRPPELPAVVEQLLPWGAVDLARRAETEDSPLEDAIAASIAQEDPAVFDPDGDGVRTYSLLALSGGGSQGAFGAGLLCGWTASGTRPNFKVVTGVSTGSLQAPFAFLGPDYDDELKAVFTEYGTEAIRTKRRPLVALVKDGLYDSAPLAELIARYGNEQMLADIAARHRAGYRLYVGTTNMDTGEFVIWDLGAIAASDQPNALERFRSVILASCSVPVLFPPVYVPVRYGNDTFYEMHCDGATFQSVFFRSWLLDFDDAYDESLLAAPPETRLFIVRNSPLGETSTRRNVRPNVVSVASRTIENAFELAIQASTYRVYVLAQRNGIEFNLAAIPDDPKFAMDPSDFDPTRMRELFDYGYEKAKDGYDWLDLPHGLDPDEIFVTE
ncbi:MAG: hypothetical protein GY715_22100, partial [Planctomycetes bacterium]|nr:hypothetical protein [Planctomycetota bacterium]